MLNPGTMPVSPHSNIRASVEFTQPAVFAGEDVECIISFTNVAATTDGDQTPVGTRSRRASGERKRKISPYAHAARAGQLRTRHGAPSAGAHSRRPSLALSTSTIIGNRVDAMPATDAADGPKARSRPGHGRSLSILSIGSEARTPVEANRTPTTATRRPILSHSRASSVQSVAQRGRSFLSKPSTAKPSHCARVTNMTTDSAHARTNTRISPATTPLSPTFSPLSSKDQSYFPHMPKTHRPEQSRKASNSRRSPGNLQHNFKFPASAPAAEVEGAETEADESPTPASRLSKPRSHTPRPPEEPPPLVESSMNPIARLISAASVSGTPRSSLDLYSTSNHSDETLASEYLPQQMFARLMPRGSSHSRQNSRAPTDRAVVRGPESLMMGYAQIAGSFTLDGSLVNQAPFEEVKRKTAVGTHGSGGVVGVEQRKRESGLFGSLGWGSIGESLTGFLGNDSSTVKDIKGSNTNKQIPLLSMPPSILFVDLQLSPGETRRYKYNFTMPKGLPPSHKGRALKVSYHVVVGVQRPGNAAAKEQLVRSHEVPFRVFSGVNARGDLLGHDLMSPHNILRATARTSSVSSPSDVTVLSRNHAAKTEGEDLPGFLEYVEALLDAPMEQSGSMGLLSPTSTVPPALRRKSSVGMEEPRTVKEAIDLAILRSNHRMQAPVNGRQHQEPNNRFTIARSGLHVATIILSRPFYRLGETIPLIIDFHNQQSSTKLPDIPTYSVQVALESIEKVDPALALRSAHSITRYTRRVHAYIVENTTFMQRLSVSLGIPPTATPDFITSGLSLEWRIRVEFVTPRVEFRSGLARDAGPSTANGGRTPGGGDTNSRDNHREIMEELIDDENGVTFQGVKTLKVETFEVSVPVRVYGAVALGSGEGNGDVEGLIV